MNLISIYTLSKKYSSFINVHTASTTLGRSIFIIARTSNLRLATSPVVIILMLGLLNQRGLLGYDRSTVHGLAMSVIVMQRGEEGFGLLRAVLRACWMRVSQLERGCWIGCLSSLSQ